MTTTPERSTEQSSNPPTTTAAQTAPVGEPPTIATGHEGTVRDQVGNYLQRVRGGDMGMLPAHAGVIVLAILSR